MNSAAPFDEDEEIRILEDWRPDLADAQYVVKSRHCVKYNCVAWATGDDSKVWSPAPAPTADGKLLGGYYWPLGVAVCRRIRHRSFV